MPPSTHIHPPKSPHGWRDATVDIAIICVGVMIALFSEQVIDRLEWHHKVHVAQAAMSRELLWDDGPQIYQRAAMHPCLVDKLDQIRAAVEANTSRAKISDLIASYHLDFNSYDMLALNAANSAQVAPHMATDELNDFLDAYAMIPLMDRTNATEAADQARLRALKRTGGPLSEYETAEVLAGVEALRNDDEMMWAGARWTLPAIAKLDGSIDPVRTAKLMASARSKYGDCIQHLPPGWSG